MIKRNLLVMGLAVLLSACGFQLRGTGVTELSLKEIALVLELSDARVCQLSKQAIAKASRYLNERG